MSVVDFGTMNANATLKEVVEELANMKDLLNFVLGGNIDFKNVRANSITADRIKANTITALQIMAGTITADKMDVAELSAITADMGHITAGDIDITTDARIGNVLYLKETDATGTKGIVFSTVAANSAKINVLSGDMAITTDGFITLTIGSSQGLVVNKKVTSPTFHATTGIDVNGVSVVLSGSSTTSTSVSDSHNHGFTTSDYIQCYDSAGVATVKKQWVPYAGSVAHSHFS